MDFSPVHRRIFRDFTERETDLNIIIELKEHGKTWAEITKLLNDRPVDYMVTQREITQQYFAFINKNSSIIDKELETLAMLDEYDRIFQLAYEGYISTTKPTASIKEHALKGNLEMEVIKKIISKEPGKANNAFLQTMVKIIEAKSKLLGLDQQQVIQNIIIPEVTTPTIAPPVRSEQKLLELMTDWDLEE